MSEKIDTRCNELRSLIHAHESQQHITELSAFPLIYQYIRLSVSLQAHAKMKETFFGVFILSTLRRYIERTHNCSSTYARLELQ